MSNYNNLKTTIDANIKQNGNQEITGPILNSVLNQMVNILGTGYQFAGVATLDPATDPGTPDAKVFYIANGKGTYEKFGGINVTEDDAVVLYWDSSWHKVSTGIASQAKLSELDKDINGGEVGIKEYVSLTSGRYFNTNTAVVGSPYSVGEPNAGATYSCVKVAVVAGEKYEVKGIAGGSATRVWVITGLGDIVLSRANHTIDYRTQPQILDITEDGFLYYNTKFEDGDYLAKIVNKIEGGYKNYVDDKIASIPNALRGKTYILCGDSQVGQTGNFPEYLEAMVHEPVYMCGFGGMRYADTANTSVGPSHNPFSCCGVADALATGDFTAIENAIETYYPTNDRYRLALANMREVYEKINATNGENVVLSIAYGSNDYNNSISLGTHGDGSRRTVIGAQEYAIETLLTKYPLMQIIIVGNPWVVTSYDETTKEILEDSDQTVRTIDGISMHRYEYSDAYLANANNHYHLKVYDMYRNCFRNKKSIWELSSDGVHPTKANGQRLLADLYFRIFYS